MIRLLTTYLRPYRRALAIVMVLVVVQALANLYLPNLNADIINNGVVKGDTGYIIRTGGLMLLVTFLVGVCAIVAVYFGSRTAMAFGRDVRSAIFRQVMSFSQKETNVFGTPSLITRNTNDVQQVQMVLVMAFNVMIMAPIMLVGGVIMALREDVPLSGLLVVIVPLVAIVMGVIATRAMPLFRSMQKRTDRIQQVMRETLSGMRVIRAFVRTDHDEARYDVANRDLTDTSLRVNRLFAIDDPVPVRDHEPLDRGHRLVRRPAHRLGWHADRQPVGLPPVRHADAHGGDDGRAHVRHGPASSGRRRADPAGPRLGGRDLRPGRAGRIAGSARRGRVRQRRVRLPRRRRARAVAHLVHRQAGTDDGHRRQHRSGKTTLVNLIPRFYDVTSGSVRIDGVDVRQMRQEDLWGLIGMVPQKAFLFSGTVASNLRYGDRRRQRR